MAKNIVIKEDGVTRSYGQADRVSTKNIDTGSTDWIPEDETKTKVKTITANGTYTARDEGCIGYTVVYVNVRPSQITGVDTWDGKTYVITVDQNGNIVRTLVDE